MLLTESGPLLFVYILACACRRGYLACLGGFTERRLTCVSVSVGYVPMTKMTVERNAKGDITKRQ